MELSSVPEGLDYNAIKWDTTFARKEEPSSMSEFQRAQSFSYPHTVDKVQAFVTSFSVSRPALERTQSQLQLDMARLEEEFRGLLVAHSHPVDPDRIFEQVWGPSGVVLDHLPPASEGEEEEEDEEGKGQDRDDDAMPVARAVAEFEFTIDLIPPDVVVDLSDIAKRMMAGGHIKECCQVYASIRKSVLDQSLSSLGMEKVSMNNVQKMVWESLEIKIKKWNIVLKVAVKVLYASEKNLSKEVFAGLNQWGETAFPEVAKNSMMQLLSFAEAIAISRRSPEKLFKVLDMYETLAELLPAIDSIFADDQSMCVRMEAKGTLLRLGEAARGIFAEFENAIQRESSKTPVPGGSIHPLTQYVMNYIWLLFCYVGPLKRLLGDKKRAAPEPVGPDDHGLLVHFHEKDNNNDADHLSPLGVQIVWLMVLLECNLDGKSKLYKEIALSYLFLMNNVHYIVQKVKKSEVKSLVGEDWVKKQSSQVRQYATNYIRASWKKVLRFLQDDGIRVSSTFSSGVSKSVLKERFKCFNASFEELHLMQATWSVPDPELREELRISIEEKVVPAYRTFLNKYQGYLGSGRERERYLKYTPGDLEKCLRDLFEGNFFTGGARRLSFSTA